MKIRQRLPVLHNKRTNHEVTNKPSPYEMPKDDLVYYDWKPEAATASGAEESKERGRKSNKIKKSKNKRRKKGLSGGTRLPTLHQASREEVVGCLFLVRVLCSARCLLLSSSLALRCDAMRCDAMRCNARGGIVVCSRLVLSRLVSSRLFSFSLVSHLFFFSLSMLSDRSSYFSLSPIDPWRHQCCVGCSV